MTAPEPAEMVSLSVRVTPDMAAALKEIADREDRPIAAELRRMIRERIDRDHASRPAAA
mgnify:CR=1 FL=1